MKSKILTVIGTRPEAIKMAPVIKELDRRSEEFESVVCVTAQHRQMLDQALLPFNLNVNHDLDLMEPNQSLSSLTARIVEGLNHIIKLEVPDVVLVQGDTTTAFGGALAGFYNQVTVGHVEAGLRTGNKLAPFPEEINRRLIGQLADLHFAPTVNAETALLREGIEPANVFVTGNPVIDALMYIQERVRQTPPSMPAGLLERMNGRDIVLVTGHRRESFGEGFENICRAIRDVADRFDNVLFVYPVHLNPHVRQPVGQILEEHPRICLLEPLAYEQFVWLMDRSEIILTDSGGVQEEAPSLGKPVLVMRDTTEREEGVLAGNARLVGANRAKIAGELATLLQNPQQRQAMGNIRNPYGDGQAARRIVDILKSRNPAP